MKYKDLIIKFVCSVICIVIMSIIILNVYNYYSDKALKNNSNNSNQSENNNNNNQENNKKPEITFKTFDFKKTYVDGFDNKVIIDSEGTDAGRVILVNDNVVASYTLDESITYGVLDDALVIRINNELYGSHLLFIDKEGSVFKEFNYESQEHYNLYIMKSIMSDYEDSIVFKNNSFTITWRVLQDESKNIILSGDSVLVVNNNIFLDKVFRKGDVIEYTLEIDYLGNKKFTESQKIEEYNLDDYIKKFN